MHLLKLTETLDFSEKLENKNISVGDVNVKWSCKGTEGANEVEFLVNGEKPGLLTFCFFLINI